MTKVGVGVGVGKSGVGVGRGRGRKPKVGVGVGVNPDPVTTLILGAVYKLRTLVLAIIYSPLPLTAHRPPPPR